MLPAVEDQIEFRDAAGAPRVLRGVIKSETDRSVILSRRDGDWEVARDRITKIVRRTKQPNVLVRAIDASRQREEQEKQAAFGAMVQAIQVLEAAEARHDPPAAINELVRRLSEARKAWRAST